MKKKIAELWTKVSYKLPRRLVKAVKYYGVDQDIAQQAVYEMALEEFLRSRGCDPDNLPSFN